MRPVDPQRVLADLRALHALTGGPAGARRLCWTDGWATARRWLRGKLAEVGLDATQDEAGNLWAVVPGRRPDTVAVGSHLDAVPAGGWLDGALGVVAGLELLRACLDGAAPERTVALVDFADEEGARFGRSVFGSSILSGTLDARDVAGLLDADGARLDETVARHGVDVARASAARVRLDGLAAYLELHIEQGPVLEAEGVPVAAVRGTVGIERHRFVFHGHAGHAGTTPMDRRQDAGLAAARLAIAVASIATARGGLGTTGSLTMDPGVVTVVPRRAELLVDLRHEHARDLAEMLAAVTDAAEQAAVAARCTVERHEIWRIEPIGFDADLVELARGAAVVAGGRSTAIVSGALHDAVEMARRVPTAMLFAPSRDGISHAADEDTDRADLVTAVEAFGALAQQVIDGAAPSA